MTNRNEIGSIKNELDKQQIMNINSQHLISRVNSNGVLDGLKMKKVKIIKNVMSTNTMGQSNALINGNANNSGSPSAYNISNSNINNNNTNSTSNLIGLTNNNVNIKKSLRKIESQTSIPVSIKNQTEAKLTFDNVFKNKNNNNPRDISPNSHPIIIGNIHGQPQISININNFNINNYNFNNNNNPLLKGKNLNLNSNPIQNLNDASNSLIYNNGNIINTKQDSNIQNQQIPLILSPSNKRKTSTTDSGTNMMNNENNNINNLQMNMDKKIKYVKKEINSLYSNTNKKEKERVSNNPNPKIQTILDGNNDSFITELADMLNNVNKGSSNCIEIEEENKNYFLKNKNQYQTPKGERETDLNRFSGSNNNRNRVHYSEKKFNIKEKEEEDEVENDELPDPRINFAQLQLVNAKRPQTSYGGISARQKSLQKSLRQQSSKIDDRERNGLGFVDVDNNQLFGNAEIKNQLAKLSQNNY